MFGSSLPLSLAGQQPLDSMDGQVLPPDMPQIGGKKGGMFGNNGAAVGQALMAAIGGYLASRGNPMGKMIVENYMNQGHLKQQESMYQRRRQDNNDDWLSHQEYEAAHRAPDDFTQMMQAAGIDPKSPDGQALYRQAVQNKANPFTQMRVQNPDGSETLQFMRPPTVPTSPVGKLTPLGAGGPSPGSGGFPY